MKRALSLCLVLGVLAALVSCGGEETDNGEGTDNTGYFPVENQVQWYNSEEVSNFGLNIAPADEMGDWVTKWLERDIVNGQGFQYYIYSDPDSWDVYLCYPDKQAEIQALTNKDIAVAVEDGVLTVYVTSQGAVEQLDETVTWVFHLKASPRGAWPSAVKLYWDGSEVPCDNRVDEM